MFSALPWLKRFAGRTLKIALLAGLFMAMAGIGAYLALTSIIKGENAVMVPDLVGKDVIYALEVLSDVGLNTRVKSTAYHDRVLKHHVIDQYPEAGSAIKKGRDVRISVSRGPETVVMPNVTGLSLQHAEVLLTENGLCRGVLARMHHNRYTAGQIIAQYPLSGSVVERKTCADLLISQGPSPAAPPLMDLTESDRQREAVSPSDQAELLRFALDYGFLKKRVRVQLDLDRLSIELFDDFLSPGQEVWLFAPIHGNPTVRVYVDDQLTLTRAVGESGD